MFYVDTPTSENKKKHPLRHIVPVVALFLTLFFITLVAWRTTNRSVSTEQQQAVNRKSQEAAGAIRNRLQMYEQLLQAGTGLLHASDKVTRAEWGNFVAGFTMPESYPGVRALGLISIIPKEQLSDYEAAIRADDLPNFSVFPAGDRPLYTSVKYVEPYNESNKTIVGFDMYTDTQRQKAMNLARDTSKPSLSSEITLYQQNPASAQQQGFILFSPVYGAPAVPTLVEQRRASLTGYTYALFHSDSLFEALLKDVPFEGYQLQVYDGNQFNGKLLYSNGSDDKIRSYAAHRTQELTFDNTSWSIVVHQITPAKTGTPSSRPLSILLIGTFISVLLTSFLYLLLQSRSRSLQYREEKAVQDAKDELLALASHQLRTPATGVKQYIGLLREGYAGNLTNQQKELIERAYDSNERQLGTINEMLFVARADAGRITIHPKSFDIAGMVNDMMQEHEETINDKLQVLKTSIPKKPLIINADQGMLRMALENILNNASKYTPPHGTITLELKKKDDRISFQVTDTGVGVSEEDQELLFKKFSRIPNELTNQVSGSGIGLYLCKTIIDAHHGSITFGPNHNHGSIVRVLLPITHNPA